MGALRNVPAMLRAFQAFDPAGNGFVTAATLRDIFERIGDAPYQPDVVDDLIAYADPGETGQVYYEPFVTRLFTEFEAAKKAKEAGNAKK
jgi:Ca2+-binding EF-hand superfamily protein